MFFFVHSCLGKMNIVTTKLYIPSLKLTASLHLKMDDWKTILSFWEGPFSGAMFILARVTHDWNKILNDTCTEACRLPSYVSILPVGETCTFQTLILNYVPEKDGSLVERSANFPMNSFGFAFC